MRGRRVTSAIHKEVSHESIFLVGDSQVFKYSFTVYSSSEVHSEKIQSGDGRMS